MTQTHSSVHLALMPARGERDLAPALPDVRARFFLLTVLLVAVLSIPVLRADAQTKVEIINDVGAKGPCLGIGIGMAIVPKCVARAEKEGFIKEKEVGLAGLSVGSSGADDGVVLAVVPGAAAANAGIQKGDRIVSVDGKTAHWTSAMEVARQTFGERDKPLTLTVRSAGKETAGATRQITFNREAAVMPARVPSGSLLLPMMVLVDWRGTFIPCTGGGLTTAISYAACAKLFRPWNYIRLKEVGAVRFTLDPAQSGAAVVKSVEQGSAAGAAGLVPGDVITAVDGHPLSGSDGELTQSFLFGPAGATRAVVLNRNGQRVLATVVLDKQPS